MDYLLELELLGRLLGAALLGVFIGFERKLRFKEAGMRTHALVSLGACLMMIISIYAFGTENKHDAARVAAQIVSGVGFLGAGMIMFKQHSGIHGLTTAAGIWATAGVGMAIGGGEYILGCGATVIIILIQCVLHLPIKLFKTKKYMQLKICFENNNGENEIVKKLFDVKSFIKVKAVKEGDVIVFTTVLSTDKIYQDTYLNTVLKENKFIRSIERIEDE